MDKVHFSTGKDDWGTPQDLFDALNKEFNFTLDPCADDNNHKCEKYYTIEQDGLAQSWAGETVFCNPPYSRKTKTNAGQIAWVQKCYKEATEGGSSWLCLYPPEPMCNIHPCLKDDEYIISTMNELCDYIRENYDMKEII